MMPAFLSVPLGAPTRPMPLSSPVATRSVQVSYPVCCNRRPLVDVIKQAATIPRMPIRQPSTGGCFVSLKPENFAVLWWAEHSAGEAFRVDAC